MGLRPPGPVGRKVEKRQGDESSPWTPSKVAGRCPKTPLHEFATARERPKSARSLARTFFFEKHDNEIAGGKQSFPPLLRRVPHPFWECEINVGSAVLLGRTDLMVAFIYVFGDVVDGFEGFVDQ